MAKKVRVTFTYLSKIENQKLSFGEFPSNELIIKLASALDADPDDLLLLAEKIPDAIRQRVFSAPTCSAKWPTWTTGVGPSAGIPRKREPIIGFL